MKTYPLVWYTSIPILHHFPLTVNADRIISQSHRRDKAIMASLEGEYNHLVLPSHIPGRADTDPSAMGAAILCRLLRACQALEKSSEQEHRSIWDLLGRTLDISLNIHGKNDKELLLKQFQALELDAQLFIIIHVVEQNAALIIRRNEMFVHICLKSLVLIANRLS